MMRVIGLIVLLLLGGVAQAMPWNLAEKDGNLQLTRRQLLYNYEENKIRGVNLGGWFVLEPFITPSLFDQWSEPGNDSEVPVDEYNLCEKLGKSLCQQRLEAHWKTWYTEEDFKNIRAAGLNTVRIPIGYWAFQLLDDDPYVQGQADYLDQALEWCREYGLKAWVDLHGAPGSQNGFDNSGWRDHYDFQKDNNVNVTLEVLDTIMKKYGSCDYYDVVIGIELLNEPLASVLNMDELKTFFKDGYKQLRDTLSVQNVVIHDSFQDMGYWDDFMQVDEGYWNVVIDHHHYQVFSKSDLEKTIDEHVATVCEWGSEGKNESHWNVVAEWSAALTDCARWLNGVGRGARYLGDYDNTPYIDSCDNYVNISSWSAEHRTNVRKFVEAQLDAYEQADGWIFWTYRTETAMEWDFSRLLAAEIFPYPVTDRQYPNQCNY